MQRTGHPAIAYHRGEAIQVDWLGQHGIETAIRILEVLPVRSDAIDRHGLRTRTVTESLTRLDAAHAWHPDVEEHDIRLEQRRFPQRFTAVGDSANQKPEQGQKSLDEQPAVFVIVCHQNTKQRLGSGSTHEDIAIFPELLRD
jgi:hypothetical protein